MNAFPGLFPGFSAYLYQVEPECEKTEAQKLRNWRLDLSLARLPSPH